MNSRNHYNEQSTIREIKDWLKRNKIIETILLFLVIFAFSSLILNIIVVGRDDIGEKLVSHWCNLRGISSNCQDFFNSNPIRIEQSLSFSLFITVIALTVFSTKLRYFAAIFAISLLVFAGVVSPQELLMGVEWRLILFLIGSMIFAYILRYVGVFRYLALSILRASKNSPTRLIIILAVISWFLAIAVDEATSIIYIVMLLLDLRKLVNKDVLPLVIVSVLATNTGSMAMPVGNPIGLYLAFSTGLSASNFLSMALPVSFISLISVIITSRILLSEYLRDIVSAVIYEKTEILITEFYAMLDKRGRTPLIYGLILLFGFVLTVSISGFLAEAMSSLYGYHIDAHSLLSFIPYVFIFLSIGEFDPEKLEKVLVHGVEWPSLFFFISLFMLGHSLLWTGVAIKIAYAMGALSLRLGEVSVKLFLIEITALTSAFLDNLSVIVAFTPVSQSLVEIGLSKNIYWSLLYGGVLGGNFTPIGSTANIVALGLCEKAHIRLTWRDWIKIALIPSTIELIVANVWALLI